MIPLPTPVPLNLALLAVWICGGALGAKRGAIAVAVYILLGAVGVPVFAGFNAGLGALAGPTGGYIIGFLPSVIVFGLFFYNKPEPDTAEAASLAPRDRQKKDRARFAAKYYALIIAKGLAAMAVCYAPGTAWFMITTGRGIWESLLLCVVPFIPGDILKVVAAVAVCRALRKPLRSIART